MDKSKKVMVRAVEFRIDCFHIRPFPTAQNRH